MVKRWMVVDTARGNLLVASFEKRYEADDMVNRCTGRGWHDWAIEDRESPFCPMVTLDADGLVLVPGVSV